MSNNNTVTLNLRLTGNAGRELARIMEQNRRDVRTINDMNRLGIRTQQQITDEIRNSERAYRRLAQSANTTQNELRRAYQAMRQQVRQLNDELRITPSLTQRIGSTFNKGTALVGGVMAGAAVANQAIKPARSYDEQIARSNATATAGQGMTMAQRIGNKRELDRIIMQASREGGSSREQVLEAANTILASGQYDTRTMAQILPNTSKTAFATGSTATDAANVALQLKMFGVDVKRGQDMAVRGGELGGFEYSDMAQWLSRQLPLAKSAGYIGEDGLKQIVLMNQLARRGSGTADEAGNNVVNLLAKLSTKEFSDAIAKNIDIKEGDPTRLKGKGKKKSMVFDWEEYALSERSKGVNKLDAFMKLIDREMAGNAQYQKLRQDAQNAKTPQDAAMKFQAMAEMVQGSKIGNILVDRQALQAALAYRNGSGEKDRILNGLNGADGTVDGLHQLFAGDEWASYQSRQNEQMNINYQAYQNVNGVLNGFNTQMISFMQKHSDLATAAYTASVALGTMAAAATTSSLLGKLGGGASVAGGVAGRVAGARVLAGTAVGAVGMGTTAGAVALAGGTGYGAGTLIYKGALEGTKTADVIGSVISKGLALLGNEEAKAANEATQKYEQMIQEQRQTRTAIQNQTNVLSSIDFSPELKMPPIFQNIINQPSQSSVGVPYRLPTPATNVKRFSVTGFGFI